MIDVETASGTGSTSGSTTTGSAGTTGGLTAGSTGATRGEDECSGLVWELDFNADPTQLDVNGDTIDDWTLRNSSPFPVGELADGVWSAQTHEPLDTRPLEDFDVRTRVTLQMRSVEAGSDRGATFWINCDYENDEFAPIFVFLNLDENGTQDLRLYGKTANPDNVLLTEVLDLPDEFIDIELDIRPQTNEVSLVVEGNNQGTFTYPTFGPVVEDRFATLFAWETDAEFRYARIDQCPES